MKFNVNTVLLSQVPIIKCDFIIGFCSFSRKWVRKYRVFKQHIHNEGRKLIIYYFLRLINFLSAN